MRGCWYKMKDESRYGHPVKSFWDDPSHKGLDVKNGGFDSNNDLKVTILGTENEGSCQVSSAIWCYYALTGNPKEDPRKHNENAIKLFYGKIKDPFTNSQTMMETMLGYVSVEADDAVTSTVNGIGANSEDLLQTMAANEGVYLIWMSAHMVACFSDKTTARTYFYDNTAALVTCGDSTALKAWVKWVCTCNNEWNMKQWTCVKCKLKAGGRMKFSTVKKAVDVAAGVGS